MRNVNNFDSNLNSMGVEYLQKFTLFFKIISEASSIHTHVKCTLSQNTLPQNIISASALHNAECPWERCYTAQLYHSPSQAPLVSISHTHPISYHAAYTRVTPWCFLVIWHQKSTDSNGAGPPKRALGSGVAGSGALLCGVEAFPVSPRESREGISGCVCSQLP